MDYIAECFEAESLKEVSLAAAAHFDRQTLIRVEKFSGLKKTLNNFNVQTKLSRSCRTVLDNVKKNEHVS